MDIESPSLIPYYHSMYEIPNQDWNQSPFYASNIAETSYQLDRGAGSYMSEAVDILRCPECNSEIFWPDSTAISG